MVKNVRLGVGNYERARLYRPCKRSETPAPSFCAEQFSLTVSADKLFPVADQVNFYVGGTLGHLSLDLEDDPKETGLLYGVQAGALFSANKNIGKATKLSLSMALDLQKIVDFIVFQPILGRS